MKLRTATLLFFAVLIIGGCHKESASIQNKAWQKIGSTTDNIVCTYTDFQSKNTYLMTQQGSLYRIDAQGVFTSLIQSSTRNDLTQNYNLEKDAVFALYDSILGQHLPFLVMRGLNAVNSPYTYREQNIFGDTSYQNNLGYQFINNTKFPGSPIHAFEVVSASGGHTVTNLYFYQYQLSPSPVVSIVKRVQLQGSNGEKFGYAGSPFAYKDKIITNGVNGEVYVSDSLGNVNLIPITANSISNIHDTLVVACDWIARKFKYSNDGVVWSDYTSFTLPIGADGKYPILENGLSLQGYSPSVSVFDYRKGLALGEMNADSIGNLFGMSDMYPLVVDSTIYMYNNTNKGVFKNSLRNLIK